MEIPRVLLQNEIQVARVCVMVCREEAPVRAGIGHGIRIGKRDRQPCGRMLYEARKYNRDVPSRRSVVVPLSEEYGRKVDIRRESGNRIEARS